MYTYITCTFLYSFLRVLMRLEIMKLAQSSCLSLRRDLMSVRNLRIITSKSLILNQSKTVLHFIYMYICIRQGFPQSMLAQSMLHELTSLIIRRIWLLDQLLKFIKNPIFIRISSNFLHNITTCMYIRKCN